MRHASDPWLHALQVLDTVWAEFLKDIDGVKTAVAGRTFSQLDPDDELRLEAGESPTDALLHFQSCPSMHSRSCSACASPALTMPSWSTIHRVACAGSLYLKTLRRLRHQWVTGITCGPQLYVDLDPFAMLSAQDKENPLILNIGSPIDDLDEEMIHQ